MFEGDLEKAKELAKDPEMLKKAIIDSGNFDAMVYTSYHNCNVQAFAMRYGIPEKKVVFHDIDKLVMLLFHSPEEVSAEHRRTAPHHNTSATDRDTLIEMVLDWESARFSKPDKPLNALATLRKYYPEMEERIMPILKEFGLDKEIDTVAISEEKYKKMVSIISVDGIANVITSFVNNEPILRRPVSIEICPIHTLGTIIDTKCAFEL